MQSLRLSANKIFLLFAITSLNLNAFVLVNSALADGQGKAAAQSSSKTNESGSESTDRLVDNAAYQVQVRAQDQLQKRIQKLPKKSESRIDYMVHLVDLLKEKTALSFRLQSYKERFRPVYKQDLDLLIKTTEETISELPESDPDKDRMVFVLGTSLDEKGDKKRSAQIFEKFLKDYPESIHRNSVIMAYTQQLTVDNKHEQAIRYLEELHPQKSSPYWTFAMHRLAWSHFNLAHYKTAISNMTEILSVPVNVISESACLDQATFAAEAIEKSGDGIQVEGAAAGFKASCKNPESYRKAKLRMAKIFRSHELTAELLKSIEVDRKEKDWDSFSEVVALAEEWAFEKRNWSLWSKLLPDVVLAAKESKSQKLAMQLGGQIKTLTDVILKNKKSNEVESVLKTLIQASQVLAEVTLEPKEKSKVYWNLGEVQFALERFKESAENYAISEQLLANEDATLRKIAATFELVQRSRKWEGLKARKMNDAEKLDQTRSGEFSLQIQNLRKWTMERVLKTESADFVRFALVAIEIANELDPAKVQVQDARDILFAKASLIPAQEQTRIASWISDSYQGNQDWIALISFSEKIQKNKDLKLAETKLKIESAGLQAKAKLIEIARSQKSETWQKDATQLLDQNPNRKELLPLQLWLVESGVQSGDAKAILGRLDQIANQYGDEALGASEWELKYALSEKERDLAGMWNALQNLVHLEPKKWSEWTLFFAFASGYPLKKCEGDLCAKLQNLRKDRQEIHKASLAFHKRPAEFRKWIKAWSALSPLEQQAFAIQKQAQARDWMNQMRSDLRKLVPIRNLSERSLIHRLEWISEIEKSAKLLASLPWLSVRKDALEIMSGIYEDFELDVKSGLANASAPAELAGVLQSLKLKSKEFSDANRVLDQELNKQALAFDSAYQGFSEGLRSLSRTLETESPSQVARMLVQLKVEKMNQVSIEGWNQWKIQQKAARRLAQDDTKK